MANPISKKLKYINKNGTEKEITLYDNPASFYDYDNGNYIAVQVDTNTVGYIYCNNKLPKDTTTHFASFIDKNNNLRYAYTKELTQSQSQSSPITYTFTTGYNVMPQINGVIYSSKYEDTINGDGTTTRALLIDEPITQINFSSATNAQHLLTVDYINASKVTDMNCMFYKCTGLKSINLSNFDTSNVTNMRYAFRDCSALTSLNLSNFNTSKVTNMHYMFRNCTSLTSLDLSSFDTSEVTDMYGMFYSCTSLTSLDLSSFDTSKVKDTKFMFNNVKSTCKVYVNKSKFTRTASQCYFSGSFTYV